MGFGDARYLVGQSILSGLTTVVFFLAYAIFSLYPFNLEIPQIIENKADFLSDGSLRFKSPGIALSKKAPNWVMTAIADNRWSINARLRPFLSEQWGPARIITLSLNMYHRNLTISQDGRDLLIRVRTKMTSRNGRPGLRIPDVFQPNRWIELFIQAGPDRLEVMIDNHRSIQIDLPPDSFNVWDPSYRLLLGNEATLNRPWLGELKTLRITTLDGVVDGLDPAAFDIPSKYLYIRNYPKLIPFRDFSVRDAIENILMYIPIGVLLGFRILANKRKPLIFAVILTSAISMAFETAQLFVTIRNPSVDDLLFNSLGGAVGVLCAGMTSWLYRRYSKFKGFESSY